MARFILLLGNWRKVGTELGTVPSQRELPAWAAVGPAMTSLTAAQRARIARISQAHSAQEEEGGELNVVPFLDIIMNVLLFVLATIAVTFTASVTLRPPSSGPGRGPAPLGLSIFAVDGGFSVKAAGGNVASGCDGAGPGLAVPARDGAYDYPALTACVEKMKRSSEAFADERQVTVTASPGIPYQTVIAVIDAVRATPGGEPLFDDVRLGVAR